MHNKNHNDILNKLRSLPRHGKAPDPDAEAKAAGSELEKIQATLPGTLSLLTQYKTIVKDLNDENTNLSMGLGKIVGIQQSYQTQIQKLVKNLSYLEEQNSELNTSFGLNSVSANKFSQKLRQFAVTADISEKTVFKFAKSLNGLTSGFIQATRDRDKLTNKEKKAYDQQEAFQTQLLQGQQYMKNNLQISDEAAEGYEYYATAVAKSGIEALTIQNKLAEKISAATGIDQLSIQRDLTEEIGGMTADLQMQYGRIPGTLELAVLKSRALGTSIADLNKMGQNLLNIESSIGQEIEYQLLTGKRLLTQNGKSLTDEYRMATMQGNANKQAELQAELIRTQGKDLEKNVFARKKAAELMGIDESQVARMIHKQKVLSSLGAERLMNLTADQMAPEIEKLKNQFKDDKEKQKEIANLIKLSDTRTTSQITNDHLAAIEANTKLDISRKVDIGKSRESIKSGVAGFDPIIKSFDSMIPSIGKLTTYTETITAIKDPLVALATNIPVLGRVITELDTKISKFLKFNLPTAGTAPSSVVDGKDVLIMPDRGPIIRPASNDVIAAFRPNDVISNTLNSSNGSIDYNKLASAIANAMRSVKVEAVVKTDNLYAANKMNNARNFS